MNPLLNNFDTAPFSKIKNQHFLPAFKKLIAQSKEEINAIINNPESPNFKNTIEALAYSGEQLGRVTSIFFNLNSAETNDELQAIAQEVSPLLTNYQNDITLNQALFNRVKSVYEASKLETLDKEQEMLLEKTYKSFVRNGASLSEKDKQKLREIDEQLAKTKLTFGQNVLAETNNYELHITQEEDLKGLPQDVIEAAAKTAKEKQKEGWVFTLDYPSYVPFVTYAENRALRKKITIAYGARAFRDNAYDNKKNVLTIAKLRYKRAKLLGYKTHAHFVLEERMAKNPETVNTFLNDLLKHAKPAALISFEELQQFANKLDGITTLEKWDGAYYSEKLKQQRFNIDQEKLKPYFKLENVIEGVFTVAKKLYNLSFTQVFDIDTYHPDVKTYTVTDVNSKDLIAIFYADFHPRPGKRGGAWMTSYKPQQIKNGKNQRPHVSIVCNFTKPTDT